MFENWQENSNRIEWRNLFLLGVFPAVTTMIIMLGVYAGVGMAIIFKQTLAKSSILFGIFSLIAILVIPHLVVSLAVGYWREFTVITPLVMAFAPLVLLVFALAVFRGPLTAPLDNIGFATLAITGWFVLSTVGLFMGTRISCRLQGIKTNALP